MIGRWVSVEEMSGESTGSPTTSTGKEEDEEIENAKWSSFFPFFYMFFFCLFITNFEIIGGGDFL